MSGEQRQRLHPLTVVYSTINTFPQLLITLFVLNKLNEGLVEIIIYAIVGALLLPAILIHYLNFHYTISSEGLTVESGLFFKNKRTIPLDRIQNVDIRQNGRQRLLRIALVSIETAGGKTPEAKLEYVSIKQAHVIREEIQGLQAIKRNTTVEDKHENIVNAEEKILQLDTQSLLRGAITKLSPVVFVLLGIFTQYNVVFQRLLEENQSVSDAVNWVEEHYVFLSIIIVFAIIFISWIGGVITHVTRYFKFTIVQTHRSLTTDSGLIGKRHSVIPIRKVQSVARRANPIMRYLGLEYIELHTAGSVENKTKSSEVLVPVMPLASTQNIVEKVFSIHFPTEFLSLHTKSAFTYCSIRDIIFLLIPTISLSLAVSPYFVFTLFLLIPILYIELYRLKKRGYVFEDDYFFIRSGVWTITEVAIPYNKIQNLTYEQSVFERIFSLSTVTIATAGGGVMKIGIVPYLPANDAQEIVEKLLKNYNAIKMKRRLLRTIAV